MPIQGKLYDHVFDLVCSPRFRYRNTTAVVIPCRQPEYCVTLGLVWPRCGKRNNRVPSPVSVPQRAPRHIRLAAMVTMTPLDVGVPLSWATECNGIKGLASG